MLNSSLRCWELEPPDNNEVPPNRQDTNKLCIEEVPTWDRVQAGSLVWGKNPGRSPTLGAPTLSSVGMCPTRLRKDILKAMCLACALPLVTSRRRVDNITVMMTSYKRTRVQPQSCAQTCCGNYHVPTLC
eukprot:5061363-Amphidinium_carterae.1